MYSAPELFFFAKNKALTVQQAYDHEDLAELFHLPLSQEAFLQLQNVQALVDSIIFEDEQDLWAYQWGSSLFDSTKVYKIMIGHSEIHPVYK
jgi:hypothetical protein